MSETSNPYIAARHEWDERYGSFVSQMRIWRGCAFVCALTAMLSVGGLLWMTRQSRVVPFVIALDGDRPVPIGRAQQVTSLDKRVIKATILNWLQDFRSVTSDLVAQRRAIDRVYVHVNQGSQAQAVISEWYRSASPLKRAQSETVSIEVNVALPISDQSFKVEWTEITRDLFGAVKTKQRWAGSFVTAQQLPAEDDEALERLNPLGIYVTQADWTKVL
jgi:type IV secretion system protein VirB5